jgi:TRAP-type C4-dicarboxylate transport system permease small subunit
MRKLVLALDRQVTGAATVAACLLLAVVAVLGVWQVGTRFVFEQPSTWTEELMRRLLVWMVMLGTGVAFRHGAMVSVDLMVKTARGRWRTVVRSIITLASVTLLVILIWYGIDLVWRIRFQTWASLDFLSMGWAYASIPVGAFISILGVLAHQLDPVDEQLEAAQ